KYPLPRRPPSMRRTLKKLVFVEPKSTHLHIYSRVCIPRLGSVLLATIMRTKGYDVRVYIEDIHDVDMKEVLSADLVAISAIISVATSRGCPFSCTFCSVPGMYGHAFRTHSVERVLQELEVHRGNLYTFFADDIFTANKKRCKELLRGMIDHDLTPDWGAQVR